MEASPASTRTSSTSGDSEWRPETPDSQLTNSLYRANTTMDELTATLTKISRAPTPDEGSSLHLQCCCGRSDCENTKAWAALHSKMESRLILCAEVGQALLEKHEAYVRRHGLEPKDLDSDGEESTMSVESRPDTPTASIAQSEFRLEARVTQLLKDNAALEKQVNTVLVNNEVAELSRKALLQELDEAKEAISRLSVSQARSAGWEIRLNTALQEKEDMRQERDSVMQRAKAAEAHVVVLRDRCEKLQKDLNRAHEEIEHQKQSRTELSEEILRDARARLQMLQQAQLGHTVSAENPEVTQFMESLVADNEALKRDIAELQNLLTESREDVRILREEIEEAKANGISAISETAKVFTRPTHNRNFSWASSFGRRADFPFSPSSTQNETEHGPNVNRPASLQLSAGPSKEQYEPLTPVTDHRPLTPTGSRTPSERRVSLVSSPVQRRSSNGLTLSTDDNSLNSLSPEQPKKSPRRQLFLLTHSRGVQTESVNWSSLFAHTGGSEDNFSSPPMDGRSESSSLLDGQHSASSSSSTIAALVDRVNTLFSRLSQADARTLTNRLKRQHLAGDVAHLSRTTVNAILSEVSSIRSHFRSVLEDEKIISTCTRRDLRALLALFREMFNEIGQMRITLNDVILDPSIAPRVSEAAMDPSKGLDELRGRAQSRGVPGLGGWMAPITKLFAATVANATESRPIEPAAGLSRSVSGSDSTGSGRLGQPRPVKFVPKLGPALAASTTTVNVEFTGLGNGRSVSSAVSTAVAGSGIERSATPVPSAAPSSSKAVLDIFVGAPRPRVEADSWVMVGGEGQRKIRTRQSLAHLKSSTLSRSTGQRAVRLPRNVDAVVDSESAIHDSDGEDGGIDHPGTLLERTLRPRGLSDSSIHSTYVKDEEAGSSKSTDPGSSNSQLPPHASMNGSSSQRQGAFPGYGYGGQSVLRAFSKTVQVLKGPSAGSSTAPSEISSSPPSSSVRALSPRRKNLLPSFSSWAAAQAGLDPEDAEHFVGSVHEETPFGRRHSNWQRDLQGRDV